MEIHAIDNRDALALAQQKSNGEVSLVGLEYNWGPPISGRFDSDFMRLWGATKLATSTGSLYLQGCSPDDDRWTINEPFDELSRFQDRNEVARCLWFLEMKFRPYPKAFVLRFEKPDGTVFYDNNSSVNYCIVPYSGRGCTAVRAADAIFDFGSILPCWLFWTQSPTLSGNMNQ